MTYAVQIERHAERDLSRLSSVDRARVLKALARLKNNPRGSTDVKPLHGSDFWRLRVGDYRVVFAVLDKLRTVLVVKIGHRRDVYR